MWFNFREHNSSLSLEKNMTWERQCNYTFQGSFTFIGFVLINVMVVPLKSFAEMMVRLKQKEKKYGKGEI